MKTRVERILEMREQGMTYHKIGQALGISGQWVRELVNIPQRPAQPAMPATPPPYAIDAAGMWLRTWKRNRREDLGKRRTRSCRNS